MRVCLDARKLWDSGIGTYIRGLLDGFSEIELCPDWDFITRRNGAAFDFLRSKRGKLYISDAGEYTIKELFNISRIANRAESDLVHIPHYVIPFNAQKPLIVTVHDLIHLKFPQYFSAYKRAYARWMIGRALKRADAILTVSKNTKNDLIANFRVSPEKISVCYVGVNRKFFLDPPVESVQKFKNDYELSNGVLLFVGNLKPHKNVSGLIDAWEELPDSVRPMLVIVGEKIGEYPSLLQKIRYIGREKEVRFLGSLSTDELISLYRCATAYVQPSWYEGFGSPPLEAMASGIPVAVSNRGSLPEIVEDAALIFDPDDRDQFTGTLEVLLTDESIRKSLSERGRDRAEGFQWKNTAKGTYEVYLQVME